MAGNGGLIGTGPTFNTAEFEDMCKTYSGTTTVSGADAVINLPFNWANGFVKIIRSFTSGEYFEDDINSINTIMTSYDALTNSNYTSDQILELLSSASPLTADKSTNLSGVPKSATTTSFTLHNSGTIVYVKYFVYAPYTQAVTMANLQVDEVITKTGNQEKSGTLTLSAAGTGLIVENDAVVYGTLTIGASSVKIDETGITYPDGNKQTSAGVPSGTVMMYGGATAPTDWLLCDGSAISRTTYARLFNAIGTTFGVGDGSTTFNVPDCRGIFVRGAGSHGSLTNANGSPFSGTLGTEANDKIQGHYHYLDPAKHTNAQNIPSPTGGGNALSGGSFYPSNWSSTGEPYNDGTNGAPRFGTETNPANICLTYIIKT